MITKIIQPVVELSDVSYAYAQEDVLENVNLKIFPGEFATIVGPNGGGKTTLVRLIMGLISPRLGVVRLFGNSPVAGRLRVGYTPQHSILDPLFPVNVRDVILMGRLGKSAFSSSNHLINTNKTIWLISFAKTIFYSKSDYDSVMDAMRVMRIEHLIGKRFGELSGGERQRVFIARALAGEPELLILDEPTNNVDPTSSQLLYELLTELNKTMTIIIVSHDFGVVTQYVRSAICVNRNVVVHPTTSLDGTTIREIYGEDVRLIRHDHRCSESGHNH